MRKPASALPSAGTWLGLGEAHVLAVAQVSLCWKRQLLAAQSECPPRRRKLPHSPGHGLAGSPGLLPAPRPGATSPKVKDKDIFRRVTEKQFGSFSGSTQACNLPQVQLEGICSP